jgi:hypothetical protein
MSRFESAGVHICPYMSTSNHGHGHIEKTNQHRWASTSILMSAISDIDICYSDIGDKYVGLKTVIPISEVFRYRHQSPFRYPTFTKIPFKLSGIEPTTLQTEWERYTTELRYFSTTCDVGYRIKLHSDIRYNVGLRSLSPISEIPISGSVRCL